MDFESFDFVGKYKSVVWLLLVLIWVYSVFMAGRIAIYQKKVSGFIVWPLVIIAAVVGFFSVTILAIQAPAASVAFLLVLILEAMTLCFFDESRSERRLREIKEGVAELKQ